MREKKTMTTETKVPDREKLIAASAAVKAAYEAYLRVWPDGDWETFTSFVAEWDHDTDDEKR